MKTDKRFMLSDRNLRYILFIKTCYPNPSFDMKEFIELFMKKEKNTMIHLPKQMKHLKIIS